MLVDRVGARARRSVGSTALIAVAIVLAGLGVVVVASATRSGGDGAAYVARQGAHGAIGVAAMMVVGRLDPGTVRRGAWLGGVASVGALAAVLSPLGSEVRGTQAWFRIGGVSLQPAESAKVALIVGLAALLTSSAPIVDPRRFAAARLLAALGVVAGLSGLVVAGGETGTVLVFVAIGFGMVVAAGVPTRMLAVVAVSGVAIVSLLVTSDVLAPYQRERLEAFVDIDADPQGANYNQRQSLVAVGSGGLTGKGLFNGPQTQLRYLPERHTDFIFAVAAEELGFAGAATIVAGQGLILLLVIREARRAGDAFGALCAIGVFTSLGFQVAWNIAMTLRLVPVAGVPLPFVSYGGSSLVSSFAALGLVRMASRSGAAESGARIHSLAAPSRASFPSRIPRKQAR